MPEPDAEPMKAAILRVHPVLADGRFRFFTAGCDSIAGEVDERLVRYFAGTAPAYAAAISRMRLTIA